MKYSKLQILFFMCWVQISCYTVIQKSEPLAKRTEQSSESVSVLEGIVKYHDGGNTQETHYHKGFILKQYYWNRNSPPTRRSVLYLEGSIDSSYMNRPVRIEGYYRIPELAPGKVNSAPDYTSEMYIRIMKIDSIKSLAEYAPGIVNVKFDKTISRTEAEEFLNGLGLNVHRFNSFHAIHWVTLKVPVGQENMWVDSLMTYPIIQYSELDYIMHIN